MDYRRIYDQFIEDRLRKYPHRGFVSGREMHHIVPRSRGGSNDESNLVSLTPADHLFAHLLLSRIHGGTLISALFLMLQNRRYQGKSSRALYERIRAAAIEVAKQSIKRAHALPRSEKQLAAMTACWEGRRKKAEDDRLRGFKRPRSIGQQKSIHNARGAVSPEDNRNNLVKARAANSARMAKLRETKEQVSC